MKNKIITTLLLIAGIQGFAQSPRLSLMEEFTGENCGPCAFVNPGLNAIMAANASKAIAIKWQVAIPSAPTNTWSLFQTNSSEINTREAYYAINAAPSAKMDGQFLSVFSPGATDNAANVSSGLINAAQSVLSPFDITLLRAWDATCSAVNLTITLQASMNYSSTGPLKFHAVMVERLIQFSTPPGNNGEYDFEDVVIKSFPSINGYTISNNWVAGQTQTFTLSCPIPTYTRDKNEIAMVGFIQDHGNKHILQAARADKVPVPAAALIALNAKVDVTCSPTIKPRIGIYNNGSTPITSFTVIPYIDLIAGNVTTWSGNLAVGTATTLTLNSISTATANGPHTFSFSLVMNNPYNFSKISNSVNYLVATSHQANPVSEDFSALTFPPLNWTSVNSNNGASWSRAANVGSYGNPANLGALKFNFYANPVVGDEDELYLPPIDLSGTAVPVLSFDLAKAQRGNANDQLVILASKDCGATWTTVYNQAGQQLATSPSASAAVNAPQAQDWKAVSVPLPGFAEAAVLVKFKAINDNGNNMFIDNINLIQPLPVGIEAFEQDGMNVSLFPNPAKDQTTLEIRSDKTAQSTIKIINIGGQVIYKKQTELNPGLNEHRIDTREFANGIYLVIIESAKAPVHKKLVISK